MNHPVEDAEICKVLLEAILDSLVEEEKPAWTLQSYREATETGRAILVDLEGYKDHPGFLKVVEKHERQLKELKELEAKVTE